MSSPILNNCTWVFAAADSDHDDREEEEEAGHGKTHPVHWLVAHNNITINLVLKTWYGAPTLAEQWDLEDRKEKKS